MAFAIPPRPLSAGEKAVVELILGQDFPGAAELRAQVGAARVVACWAEGSASIDLTVRGEDVPRAAVDDGVLPVPATVVDGSGSVFGEILLWVDGGHLSAVEYAWYGDEPPSTLPEPGLISLTVW